ncbi:MAG TPA: hypothetical protein PKZ16_00535 [bacterium]|nr:hypothetical protein [bacterium]HPL95720.1 hypothetical protein [bacterium]
MNLSRLIDWRFIFNANINAIQTNIFWFLVIFFAALITLALVSYFLKIKASKNKNWPHKRLWQKIFNFGLWSGLVGFLLLFFRQQSVYFLAMPLFFYLWLIGVIFNIILIINWARTKMIQDLKELKTSLEKKKYLP